MKDAKIYGNAVSRQTLPEANVGTRYAMRSMMRHRVEGWLRTAPYPSRLPYGLAWAATLWLLGMAGWYVWTAVLTVHKPFNSGWDRPWAITWVAVASAVILSHWFIRRRAVTVVWFAIVALIGVTMLVLSQQWLAGLITIWLLALGWAWADNGLHWLGARSSGAASERLFLGLALGIGLLSMLGLALAATHNLTPRRTWFVLAILTLMAGWTRWRAPGRVRSLRTHLSLMGPRTRETAVLVVLLGWIALLNLTWALAPEIQYDALNYHLAVPRIYIEQRGLVDLPYFYHSYFARLVDMLFALGLALHGAALAKLLAFAISLIATLGVYCLGRAVFTPRVGLWAAVLFCSTPLVSWLATTAYIDLAVGMFLVATWLAWLRWREAQARGWLWATALLAGLALGAKPSAVYGLPVVVLSILGAILLARDTALSTKIKTLTTLMVSGGLAAGLAYASVFTFTGNPFASFLDRIGFGQRLLTLDGGSSLTPGEWPVTWLSWPLALTFQSYRFGEGLPAGGLGLAFVLLPLALGLLSQRRVVTLLIAQMVVFVALWILAISVVYARYAIPGLPLISVLTTAGALHLAHHPWAKRLTVTALGSLVIAQGVITPVQFWNIPERFPVQLAFGRETQEDFLTRALPAYAAVQYLNGVVEPGQRVLGVNAENMRFYLDAPLASWDETEEIRRLTRRAHPAQLAVDLDRSGYAYLLAGPRDPIKTAPLAYLSPAFLSQFARLEFQRQGWAVYRLQAKLVEPVAAVNLLTNPGFETLDEAGQPVGWSVFGDPAIVEDTDRAYAGEVSVEASVTDTLAQPLLVQGGALYTLGHFSRADSPHQVARLQINWQDQDSQFIEASIDVVVAGSDWTWHALTVTAPAAAAKAIIYVSGHATSRVQFDAIWFGPGAPPAPPPKGP